MTNHQLSCPHCSGKIIVNMQVNIRETGVPHKTRKTEYSYLQYIFENPKCIAWEIARHFDITTSSVYHMTKKLRDFGLITSKFLIAKDKKNYLGYMVTEKALNDEKNGINNNLRLER